MQTQPNTQVNNARQLAPLMVAVVLIIVLGLGSRKFSTFPAVLGKYPGDALWGMMVYFLCVMVKPNAKAFYLLLAAFLVSCLDEFSQLIQTPWLNDIRHTIIGHLILGTVFSWEDILAYAVGIVFAVIIDSVFIDRKFAKPK